MNTYSDLVGQGLCRLIPLIVYGIIGAVSIEYNNLKTKTATPFFEACGFSAVGGVLRTLYHKASHCIAMTNRRDAPVKREAFGHMI